MTGVLAALVPLLVGAVVFLVVQNHEQDQELLHQGHQNIQQNVKARYDDCVGGEQVRTALREQVINGARTDKLLYHLLPSLNTPIVHELVAQSRADQLKAYAPRDCSAYALAAVPPLQRHSYHAP